MLALLCAIMVAAPVTVSVDMTAVDARTFRQIAGAGLYKSLLVHITQEELAVVAGEEADITLTFEVSPIRNLQITASGGGHETIEIALDKGDRPSRRLLILHRCVELLRRQRDTILAHRQIEEPPPVIERVEPPKPKEKSRLQWAIVGDIGGNFSGGQRGLQSNVALRVGSTLGLRAELSLYLPLALDDRLSVIEWTARLGGDARLALSSWLVWENGLGGGLLHHHWSAARSATEGAGDVFEPVGYVWSWLAFELERHWWIGPSVAAQIGPRARNHIGDGRSLWRTGPVRVVVGARLSYLLGN